MLQSVSMPRRPSLHKDAVRAKLRTRRKSQECPPGFFTRGMLREKLGLKENQIRSLVASGDLAAVTQNTYGYAVYSEAAVQRLLNQKADGTLFKKLRPQPLLGDDPGVRMTYAAEEGVTVFELLAAGKTLEQIIIGAKIHPLVAKRIREDYDDITGSLHIPRSIVDQINKLHFLPGSFPVHEASALLDTLQQCSETRACSGCNKNEASALCRICQRKEIVESQAREQAARERDREAERSIRETAVHGAHGSAHGNGSPGPVRRCPPPESMHGAGDGFP